MSDVARWELLPGPLGTTLHKAALPEGWLQASSNCRRDRGVFEADQRPRYWQTAPASGTVQGALVLSLSSCDRVMEIRNSGLYSTDLALSTAGESTGWTAQLATLTAGGWYMWDHMGYAMYAGGQFGYVGYMGSLCGTPSGGFVGRTWGFLANQVVASVAGATSSLTLASHGTEVTPLPPAGQVRWTDASQIVAGWLWSAEYDTTFPWPTDYLDVDYGQMRIRLAIGAVGQRWGYDACYVWPGAQNFTGTGATPLGIDGLLVKFTLANDATDRLDFSGEPKDDPALWLCSTSSADPDTDTWAMALGTPYDDRTDGADLYERWYFFDLRTISTSILASVTKLRLRFPSVNRQSGGYRAGWMVADVQACRRKLKTQSPSLDVLNEPKEDLEYWVRWTDSLGGNVSAALPARIVWDSHLGDKVTSGLAISGVRVGSHVSLTIKAPGAPWNNATDRLLVYRKVVVRATGQTRYYKVSDTALGAFADQVISDIQTDAELIAGAVSYVTTFDAAGLQPTGVVDLVPGIVAGASWKGSNVLCRSDGWVFCSEVDSVFWFYWPDGNQVLDENFDGRAVSFRLTAEGRPVIAAVSQDALYMFTRTEAWALAGAMPALAGDPRRIGGVQGACGPYAACAHRGGALVGNDRGLWWVRVPYGWDGVEPVDPLELTADVRDSWAWLIGSASERAALTIAEHRGHVWAFCGLRYLHLSPEGIWAPGTLTGSDGVFRAFGHPVYGLVACRTSGRWSVWGDYPTDDSTVAAGTGGTAYTWTAKSRRELGNVSLLRASVEQEFTTASAVQLTVTTDRGGTDVLSFSGSAPGRKSGFPRLSATGGDWFEAEISGGGLDRVLAVVLEVKARESRQTGQLA